MQSAIELTTLHLQCKKIDDVLNLELNDHNVDDARIRDLTTAKKRLLDSIQGLVKDNNLASNYNEKSKRGADTLSAKLKEMSDNGFESIKVNAFDIKTSEAMKQIIDLSNKSILEQIQLDNSEYADMVKEQREIILRLESQLEERTEENRNLTNQVIDLKAKKKVG
jgi:hypothetical protein